MRQIPSRVVSVTGAGLALLFTLGSARAAAPAAVPELLVVSSSDVRGETHPCGCHVPKGGLARRAAFVDSLRGSNTRVLLLDAGGYFSESPERQGVGPFHLEAMKRMGTEATTVGPRDLAYGLSYLRNHARAVDMPIVCANLIESATGRPAFETSRIVNVDGVSVGVFGLFSPRSTLGTAGDSLHVGDPTAAAMKTVTQLRAKGATVIVLLSQLGRADSQALAGAVSGIDEVVVARSEPVVEASQTVGNTLYVHGGQNGWYLGMARLKLDARRRVVAREGVAAMLGPDIRDQPAMLGRVNAFEDALLDGSKASEPLPTTSATSPGDANHR